MTSNGLKQEIERERERERESEGKKEERASKPFPLWVNSIYTIAFDRVFQESHFRKLPTNMTYTLTHKHKRIKQQMKSVSARFNFKKFENN